MLVRFSYPVNSDALVRENWLVTSGGFEIEWKTEDGRITGVTATSPASPEDLRPTVQMSKQPGVALEIHAGKQVRTEEAEHLLRTIQGTLSLFCSMAIDFNRYEVEWIPETDEERQKLSLFSLSRMKGLRVPNPREISFDLFARSTLSAPTVSEYEVPLSFLRRGQIAVAEEQYIEAFYYLFFFLETQYAPGLSNPNRVKEKFKRAPEIGRAINKARPHLISRTEDSQGLSELLQLTVDKLIDHIVNVRGNLHHHALPRAGVWHPEKQENYRAEALILHAIDHEIAVSKTIAWLYTPEADDQLFSTAKDADATTALVFEVVGDHQGVRREIGEVKIIVPGKRVSRALLDGAHQTFREHFAKTFPGVELHEYKVKSEDKSTVYASYSRTPAP